MSLKHGVLLVSLLGLAFVTVACPMAIDEEELAQTPVASPSPGAAIVTPSPIAPVETASPVAEATEDCGGVNPEDRIPTPPAVDPPEAFAPIPFVADIELEALLREILGQDIDSYSVVVKNLADGSGVMINADQEYYAASLFKVAVMYEAFHERSLGLLSFDEELMVAPYYATFDLGTHVFPTCSTATVEQLLAAMMSVSDNTSAVMLQDKVGSRHINEAMEALGLKTTRILEDKLPATAADMALLMEMIAMDEAVDPQASQEMAGLLASERVDNGLRAGVPQDTLVAHKTGNWVNATHDVGIVYSPAATYVVAVLSDKGFGDHADKVITQLSRTVWEYYNGALGEGEGE
jgi:beta-lactamase class A